MSELSDAWDSGAAYEAYVGRWSRRVAQAFLAWIDIPAGSQWLDIGCGSGALSQAILECASPKTVLGVDRAEGYVAYARNRIADTRAKFKAGDAQQLPVGPTACDAVVSGLVLNFITQPPRAVAEMARVAKPSGTVAAYVWDYAGRMQFMRYFWDVATALDLRAADLDEGRRFPICKPKPLARLFRAAGLAEVEARAIDIQTPFRDFNDYWLPFLGGQGPAPTYVASLDDERRTALRERLKETLPARPDGTIHLMARAWAVKGKAI